MLGKPYTMFSSPIYAIIVAALIRWVSNGTFEVDKPLSQYIDIDMVLVMEAFAVCHLNAKQHLIVGAALCNKLNDSMVGMNSRGERRHFPCRQRRES
jgi:hypothetical protein